MCIKNMTLTGRANDSYSVMCSINMMLISRANAYTYATRYVELKNSPAAIEAYRRAVEINPRDYRAWCVLLPTHTFVF